MNAFRCLAVAMTFACAACATATTPLVDDQAGGKSSEDTNGGSAGVSGGSGGVSGGSSAAGKSGNGSGGAGTNSGGAMTGGSGSNSGGKASGGSSMGGAGSGGGGSSGAANGGGGSAGTAGSGGSGGQASGTCAGVAPFALGASTKYALDEKVTAMCSTGTPCTQHQPAGQSGKTYEFKCTDQYNCGTQDPSTCNWSTPPWTLVQECTP